MEGRATVFPKTQLKVPRKNTARKSMKSGTEYRWLPERQPSWMEDSAASMQQQGLAGERDMGVSVEIENCIDQAAMNVQSPAYKDGQSQRRLSAGSGVSVAVGGARVSVVSAPSTKTSQPGSKRQETVPMGPSSHGNKCQVKENIPSKLKVKVSAKNGSVASKGLLRTPSKHDSKHSNKAKRHSDGHQNVVDALFDNPLMVTKNKANRPKMGTLMRAPTVRTSMENKNTPSKAAGSNDKHSSRISAKHIRKSNNSMSRHKKHKRTFSDPLLHGTNSKEKREERKKLKSRKYSYQPMESTPIKDGARETLRDILGSEQCESIISVGSAAAETNKLVISRQSVNESPAIVTAGNTNHKADPNHTACTVKITPSADSTQSDRLPKTVTNNPSDNVNKRNLQSSASGSSISGLSLGKSQLGKQRSKSKLGRHRSISNQETSSTSESSHTRGSTAATENTRKRSCSESARDASGENIFDVVSKMKKAKLNHPSSENAGLEFARKSKPATKNLEGVSVIRIQDGQFKQMPSDYHSTVQSSKLGVSQAMHHTADPAGGTGLLADVEQVINTLEQQTKHRSNKDYSQVRRHASSSSRHRSKHGGSVSRSSSTNRRRLSSRSSASSGHSSGKTTPDALSTGDDRTLKDEPVFDFTNIDRNIRSEKLTFNFVDHAQKVTVQDGDRQLIEKLQNEGPLKMKLKKETSISNYGRVVKETKLGVQDGLLTCPREARPQVSDQGQAIESWIKQVASSTQEVAATDAGRKVRNDNEVTRAYGESSDEDRLVIDVEADSLISSSVARCINQPLTSTPSGDQVFNKPGLKVPPPVSAGAEIPGASTICLEQEKAPKDPTKAASSIAATKVTLQPVDTQVDSQSLQPLVATSDIFTDTDISNALMRHQTTQGSLHPEVPKKRRSQEHAPVQGQGHTARSLPSQTLESLQGQASRPPQGHSEVTSSQPGITDHTLNSFSNTGPLHSTLVTSAQSVAYSIPGLQTISPVVAAPGVPVGVDLTYIPKHASPTQTRSSCMYGGGGTQIPVTVTQRGVAPSALSSAGNHPPHALTSQTVVVHTSADHRTDQTPHQPLVMRPQFVSPLKLRPRVTGATFSHEQPPPPAPGIALIRHPVEPLFVLQDSPDYDGRFPPPHYQRLASACRPSPPYVPSRPPPAMPSRQLAPARDMCFGQPRHILPPRELQPKYPGMPPSDQRVNHLRQEHVPRELTQPMNLTCPTSNKGVAGPLGPGNHNPPVSSTSSAMPTALSPQSSKVLQEVEGLLRQAWELQTTALQALQSNLSHKYSQVESLKSELAGERHRRHMVEQQLYHLQMELQGSAPAAATS